MDWTCIFQAWSWRFRRGRLHFLIKMTFFQSLFFNSQLQLLNSAPERTNQAIKTKFPEASSGLIVCGRFDFNSATGSGFDFQLLFQCQLSLELLPSEQGMSLCQQTSQDVCCAQGCGTNKLCNCSPEGTRPPDVFVGGFTLNTEQFLRYNPRASRQDSLCRLVIKSHSFLAQQQGL